MRSPEEIQEAHDFLHAVIEYDQERPPNNKMPAELRVRIHVAHDALGYVLGCPCGETFEKNLATIRKTLDDAGFKLIKFTSHPE